VSDDGYGANEYIETSKPLVVITGPDPTAETRHIASQLYHEYRRGIHAGYAKFETFPIWNLPSSTLSTSPMRRDRGYPRFQCDRFIPP